MRSMCTVLAFALLVAAGATAAETITPDDVIKMTKQGVAEDILTTIVDRSDNTYNLTADQIVKLKEGGVSDKVIAVMLRKKGTTMLPPVEVAPRAPAMAPTAPAMAQGTLNVENVDDLPWAYRLDPNTKILWISKPDATSDKVLPGHGGVSLTAAVGAYEVRYVGEDSSNPLTVVAGQASLVMVSRVATQDFEGLYVSVFEQGERKGGGRLAILRQAAGRTIGQPKATYQYLPAKTPSVEEQPQGRVIERERVVVEPSTTVIYRPAPVYVPNYYGPTYYGPTYAPSYYDCNPYYPWNRVFMRYGDSHRRSGWSVGLGFGF